MHREMTPVLQEMTNYNYAPHQKDLAYENDRALNFSSNGFSKLANQTAPFSHHDNQTGANLTNENLQHNTAGTQESLNASRPRNAQAFTPSEELLQSIESNLIIAAGEHWEESKDDNASVASDLPELPELEEDNSIPEISFANVRRLPLRLPRAPLRFISNPREDLPEHLYRHGLAEDAKNFAAAKGITVDFALAKWVQHSSSQGATGLLKMTCWLMDTFHDNIKEQLSEAQAKKQALPRHFAIPTADLNKKLQDGKASGTGLSLPPTHILAVHSSQANAGEENGMLIPCHAMLYVLQCVSLPRLGESTVTMEPNENNGSSQSFPVVPILVPRPKEFVPVHQFIYNRDAAALLMDLLPLRQIVQSDNQTTLQQQFAATSLNDNISYGSYLPVLTNTLLGIEQSVQLFARSSLSQQATEFLADQPTHDLFAIAYRINSVWANGVAIGLTDPSFWNALQTGWTLIIAALGCKKGRLFDIESRGLNLGLRRL
ncbi:uncharacterized protein FA14DRAFT_173993 [Meira miltonrushii]|uniref:Uncharacterized protein n=1 Tax=Meira miltonrushii TaxID=1280837 RepID=A0A316V9Q6_9BASI|nr:uncharacterized protein FA14DRAFT_173993 [Meira miltonrushii]PWN34297.1 hypothetical protein FA14DRAFT_173993 [Meira miltonrushii]